MMLKNCIGAVTAFALCLSAWPQSASPHSGIAQDPWNPAHLNNLPSEIRVEVKKWEAACGAPIAVAQRFALYLTVPRTQFVALHFDDFRCRNNKAVCNTSGCLHEVYAASRGRYRKVLTVHAEDVRLLREQDAALLEIQDRPNVARRLLRWNGTGFTNWTKTKNR
jgi:hypothetical protein